MANLRTIKKPLADGISEVVSIRVPKALHSDLVVIYADRIRSSGEVESFSQTVIDVLQKGVNQYKTVA